MLDLISYRRLSAEGSMVEFKESEYQEFNQWINRHVLEAKRTRTQQAVRIVGGTFGALSFAFSGVLGFQFGKKVADIFKIKNLAGIYSISGVFSASAYIPLAMLCAPHASDTFESFYLSLCRKQPDFFKTLSRRHQYLYYTYLFIIWMLGAFAAADSTRLTHALFSDLIDGAVYPLDIITQIAMTILRAWSLENLISIGSNHILRPLFYKLTDKKYTTIEIMRENFSKRLNYAAMLISNQSEEIIDQVYERLESSKSMLDLEASEKKSPKLIDFLRLADSADLIKPEKNDINQSWGRALFCFLGSAIGALSINGFIPPAKDIGNILSDFLNIPPEHDHVRQSLGNLFAASISICFGSLTVYAPYLIFGNLYDWSKSKFFKKNNSEISKKTNFKGLIVFIALLIAAGSAIPATELSITYTDGEVKKYLFSSAAFIGLFATDYFPLEEFIQYLYEGKTKKTHILNICSRIQQVLPRLSDQTIFSLYQQEYKATKSSLVINDEKNNSKTLAS